MPTSPNTLGFSSYSQKQEEIQRRKKIAELLMQQSMSPMEQQQAPGIVVPVSPLQAVAKLVQGYSAGAHERKAKE